MKDRFKLDLFYSGAENGLDYVNAQTITEEVFSATSLSISMLAMDFPNGTSFQHRKRLERKWIELLPSLDLVKSLSLRHRVSQEFFDAVCRMKNLERVHFWTSTVEDISSISKLQNLMYLGLDSFNRLTTVRPILSLANLQRLAVENSFKINDYELIGQMLDLVGLKLGGDSFAPRNLRLESLKHFRNLKELRHLDLRTSTVVDKSYDAILELSNLQRFDIIASISTRTRKLILENNKKLTAGLFIDWDYDNNRMYEGKEW